MIYINGDIKDLPDRLIEWACVHVCMQCAFLGTCETVCLYVRSVPTCVPLFYTPSGVKCVLCLCIHTNFFLCVPCASQWLMACYFPQLIHTYTHTHNVAQRQCNNFCGCDFLLSDTEQKKSWLANRCRHQLKQGIQWSENVTIATATMGRDENNTQQHWVKLWYRREALFLSSLPLSS